MLKPNDKKADAEIILRNIKTIRTYPFSDGTVHIHLNSDTTKAIIVLRDSKRTELTFKLLEDNKNIVRKEVKKENDV